MPFWVYGRDAANGQPRDPLFLETEHEEDARSQAAEAGMKVEELEFVKSPQPEEDVRCAKCGSQRVVPRATICDHGEGSPGYLQAYVCANPDALLLKGTAYATLSARICADCGAAELYVRSREEAEELYQAYRKSKSGGGPAEPDAADVTMDVKRRLRDDAR